ncbi:hypothetical protein SNE40_016185 [Patella caerulea]|uniref:Uncharacterized protein n=1 Tax=Patella caerulea TaxID=87958 RepID=A0AAN8JBF3_PATCE
MGRFNLRKWYTNDLNLRKRFSETDNSIRKHAVKILGLIWDTVEDNLKFDLACIIEYAKQLPLTKRSVLKLAVKIFDPLGLLSPFTVNLKIKFPQMGVNHVDWDTNLDSSLRKWWNISIDDLIWLADIRIPRCYTISRLILNQNTRIFNSVLCRSYYTKTNIQIRHRANKRPQTTTNQKE